MVSSPAAIVSPTSRHHNWLDRGSYRRHWAKRARVAARLCKGHHWICDLGCGMQELRYFLPRKAIYLPADLNAWTEDTERCDLDAGIMPVQSLRLGDLCVLLGVVGHLRYPERCFRLLSEDVETVLFSYQSKDFLRGEKSPNRVNNFALEELYLMVQQAEFEIVYQAQYRRSTFIKARNTRFDAAAVARREELRKGSISRLRTLRDEWMRLVLGLRTRRVARYPLA
jgi:hypothetical protein